MAQTVINYKSVKVTKTKFFEKSDPPHKFLSFTSGSPWIFYILNCLTSGKTSIIKEEISKEISKLRSILEKKATIKDDLEAAKKETEAENKSLRN